MIHFLSDEIVNIHYSSWQKAFSFLDKKQREVETNVSINHRTDLKSAALDV